MKCLLNQKLVKSKKNQARGNPRYTVLVLILFLGSMADLICLQHPQTMIHKASLLKGVMCKGTYKFINRPSVAGAVLQTLPLLIT